MAGDPKAGSLRLSQWIAAPREEVFAAWTDPETLRRFMCPGDVKVSRVEVDARVGGAFRIDMDDGTGPCVHTGVYLEITPPEKLVFTWRSRATEDVPSVVAITLHERDGGTELVLVQERLPSARAVVQHSSGWTKILGLLAAGFAPAAPERPTAGRSPRTEDDR